MKEVLEKGYGNWTMVSTDWNKRSSRSSVLDSLFRVGGKEVRKSRSTTPIAFSASRPRLQASDRRSI
jgi:hypothetical protein